MLSTFVDLGNAEVFNAFVGGEGRRWVIAGGAEQDSLGKKGEFLDRKRRRVGWLVPQGSGLHWILISFSPLITQLPNRKK